MTTCIKANYFSRYNIFVRKRSFSFLSFSGRSRKREHCLKEDLYPLVGSEPCVCDKVISEPWGNWSVCILPSALPPLSPHGWRGEREVRECGEGKRYQALACLDQRGRLLDPSHCAERGQSEPLNSPQKDPYGYLWCSFFFLHILN